MALPSDKALNKAIGRILRTHRENLKKSIDRVATDCKMKSNALEKMENGEGKIRLLTLQKLCKYYEIAIDEFLELAENYKFMEQLKKKNKKR
jgi:transcriptional regulator with XRE-family HTH domain